LAHLDLLVLWDRWVNLGELDLMGHLVKQDLWESKVFQDLQDSLVQWDIVAQVVNQENVDLLALPDL